LMLLVNKVHRRDVARKAEAMARPTPPRERKVTPR
jgi:hypothetical protein